MPIVEHAVRLSEKAGAEDHIGPAIEQRCEELGILPGVVFEIGILHDHDVAGGGGEACPQRGPLAGIPLMQAEREVGPRGDMLGEPLPCAIRRAVVHDDDLHRQPVRQRCGPDPLDDLREQRAFVVDRDDDTQFHRRGSTGCGHEPGLSTRCVSYNATVPTRHYSANLPICAGGPAARRASRVARSRR